MCKYVVFRIHIIFICLIFLQKTASSTVVNKVRNGHNGVGNGQKEMDGGDGGFVQSGEDWRDESVNKMIFDKPMKRGGGPYKPIVLWHGMGIFHTI